MIVLLEPQALPEDAERVRAFLVGMGLWCESSSENGIIRAWRILPHSAHVDAAGLDRIRQQNSVAGVLAGTSKHPLLDAMPRVFTIHRTEIGRGKPVVVMAGPCSVESAAQIDEAASAVAAAGGRFLRGSAYKPRSSPYGFSGYGVPALRWLRDAADRYGLGVISEVTSENEVAAVAQVADLVQIGARHMHDFALLRAVAAQQKPALLKRAPAATVEEWLLAAECLLAAGAPSVIFCERGIRGFDPSARNLADIGAVALLANVYGLPVVVDPSHGAGRRDLIVPLSCAGVAAGAAGILVEAHPDPSLAQSDGPQALLLRDLPALASSVHRVQQALA